MPQDTKRSVLPRPIRAAGLCFGLSFVVAGAGLLTAGLTGCNSESAQIDGREPDQVYTLRGVVRQLPDAENPAMGLQIQHENIPDFVNRDGEVVGMNPMIMPFTPAPRLDLSRFALGDKIRFTFDVDWDASPTFVVTDMEPLPPETEMDFSMPPDPAPGG